ncbi:MAG: rhodanese-like domain-containing protein [Hyphomicrobiaceae bacterium]
MTSEALQVVKDVPVSAAWQRLVEQPAAVLIDVRTRAEWAYVGIADLASIGKELVLVEWQGFPDNRRNPAFVAELGQRLDALGVGRDSELYFICRSGARSRLAAEAMQAAGYARCFNVAEGFEGPLDGARHRGGCAGWKAQGLPWVQT